MEELIGTIKLFAGNYAPQGYFFCQGQTLQISQYQALFTILGTTYGGDGKNTFALPDLRSRVPVGAGQGTGLSNIAAGQKVGNESNQLTKTQLPDLQATVNLSALKGTATGTVATSVNASIPVPCGGVADKSDPEYNVMGTEGGNAPIYTSNSQADKFMQPLTATLPINFTASLPVTLDAGSATVVVNDTKGAQQAINNIQPSLGLNYIICWYGIYPDRP